MDSLHENKQTNLRFLVKLVTYVGRYVNLDASLPCILIWFLQAKIKFFFRPTPVFVKKNFAYLTQVNVSHEEDIFVEKKYEKT